MLINWGAKYNTAFNTWTQITFPASHYDTDYILTGTVHSSGASTQGSGAALSMKLDDSSKPRTKSSCYLGVVNGTTKYPIHYMTVGKY